MEEVHAIDPGLVPELQRVPTPNPAELELQPMGLQPEPSQEGFPERAEAGHDERGQAPVVAERAQLPGKSERLADVRPERV